MPDITNALMYEILKDLQAGQKDIKGQLRELKDNVIGVRDDIHGLRGDVLRQERSIASLEVDVERINHRLDLGEQDPPQ